jgi:hypothetical protein
MSMTKTFVDHRDHMVLRGSFWVKLFFIILEIGLAIGFGVCNFRNKWNAAAVLEWTIAFIFTFYIFSFFIDLVPAVQTKHNRYSAQETELEREIGSGEMRKHGTPMAPSSVDPEKPLPVASNF